MYATTLIGAVERGFCRRMAPIAASPDSSGLLASVFSTNHAAIRSPFTLPSLEVAVGRPATPFEAVAYSPTCVHVSTGTLRSASRASMAATEPFDQRLL